MLRHQDVWRALDRLAEDHGFSPSGLARQAGLDPTTFNKSKRVAQDGRPRWPSTESIAKVLEATEASLGEFVTLVVGKAQGGVADVQRRIPVAALGQTTMSYFDKSGHPSGTAWDELPFPEIVDAHAYALEIAGHDLEPVYRAGDTIVVSPEANLRKGDRVVVRTTAGEIIVRALARRGARKLELAALTPSQGDRSLPIETVAFIHRIIWASQ
jgi:phage repressor protein C with HTH and peptisase S24 domain